MGGDSKTTDTSQSSLTNPWAPTIPALSNIITQLGNVNTGVTGSQSGALNNLQTAANGLPDFSGGVTGAVNTALGTNTSGAQGILSNAYSGLQKNLGSTADGSELNPYSTPGFSDALGTATQDAMNAVKGTFAGSGRDPSGAGSFAQSGARGILQATAPIIQSQYNTNKSNQMNAATDLYGAGNSTASGLTQQQLSQLQGQSQGVTEAGAAPGILTGNATAQLGAANAGYNTPLSNISGVSGLLTGIAGLGGQSSGTGTSTTTTSQSPFSTILGGLSGLSGLNGAMGGGWLSKLGTSALALSDRRAKEDVHEIGKTHEGQPLYSFRYVGKKEPRIGLMAQDEEKRDPRNVTEVGGIKHVNYDRALHGSKRLGMLKMAA